MTKQTEAVSTNLDSFETLDVVSDIEHYRSNENGLQVLLLRQTAAPVVTFMITYHVGSRNESIGHTGATHFLEHLMFKGTKRYNKQNGTSVFNVLQSVGAQVNATTWFDRTNYYELLPSEHLSLAADIESDRLRGARLAEDDLESERTVILNEFDRGENDPIRKLYHTVWAAAYVAHPYHHPTIGWRSDIEEATRSKLKHFYDTFYWPNNATLSIIGDFDRIGALKMVHQRFGSISASPDSIPEVSIREPEQRGMRRAIVKRAGELGAVMLGFKSPPGLQTDTDALDVLSIILASGKKSRLYQSLTDSGKTTSVFASVSRLRDAGLFTVYAFLSPGKTHEEIEESVFRELDKIGKDGVSSAEVERAQNQRRAQEAFGRDGPFAIASQLNEAIAAGDWKLYADYLTRIQIVTPEDIQRVAREYLIEDRCTIGWFVPE